MITTIATKVIGFDFILNRNCSSRHCDLGPWLFIQPRNQRCLQAAALTAAIERASAAEKALAQQVSSHAVCIPTATISLLFCRFSAI